MLPEDERRLQREADIAMAKAGPNYSLYNEEVRKEKIYAAKRGAMSRDYDALTRPGPKGDNSDTFLRAAMSREQFAHARAVFYLAVRLGKVKRVNGKTPPFRSDPTISRG